MATNSNESLLDSMFCIDKSLLGLGSASSPAPDPNTNFSTRTKKSNISCTTVDFLLKNIGVTSSSADQIPELINLLKVSSYPEIFTYSIH